MEEGTKSKKTVFVGGISEDTDETTLYEGFSTFGVFVIHFLSSL
jgi:RNA recognition motif-containing protein